MSKFQVLPHDPRWRSAFAIEARAVTAIFGKSATAIHHIGSTAIPGIYAKPVIDMLVEVSDLSEAEAHSIEMAELGYEVMGEFGIPGRRYFRKDNAAGVRIFQIHVFQVGSDQIRRHLAFRDFLRENADDARAYSELKRRLADEHADNVNAYIDGKDGFIKEIDRRAAESFTSG